MNNNSNKQILLSVIGVAILVVAVVGVSFAFFTYLGGEAPNTVKTGTILFDTTVSGFSLEDQFPTTAAEATTSSIKIKGNTTYTNGIDFEIKVTAVSGNVNALAYPTITVTPAASLPTGVTMESTAIDAATVTAGTVIATGHIGTTADIADFTEVLKISAFYDKAKYHISDTPKQTLVDGEYIANTVDVLTQAQWNALEDYSFTIQVVAFEGTGAGA